MGLGTNHIDTTKAAVFIPELWETQVIIATESNLVFRDLIMDYGILDAGDTLHIPKISNLTTNTKAAGSPVTFQSPTEGEATITINKHEEASVLVEDLTKAQANINLLNAYTQKAGYALAKTIDSDIAGLYSGLSQEIDASAGLTNTNLSSAVNLLDLADVPQDNRYFVFHYTALPTLLGLEKFTSQDYVEAGPDGRPIQSGVVHRLFGVPVIFTNQIVSTTVGSDTFYHGMLLHKEAFGMAWSIAPSVEGNRSTEYLSDFIVVHAAYGVAELRDDFAIEISTKPN